MQCKNCGANLVRGFSFCLDCGLPVPPEALEESGLPQRNIDSGPQEPSEIPQSAKTAAFEPETTGDVKPQMQGIAEESSGADLKPKYLGGEAGVGGADLKPQLMGIGEELSGADLKAQPIGGTEESVGGADVHAAMQNSSADAEGSDVEKLVFCPNCGMRMQQTGGVCDKCGMVLGPKPKSAPAPASSVPLFNNDEDAFGGFGGDLAGLSDDEASRIDRFVNGGLDPMFNSGGSGFSVQATPDDFAQLNEQLAGFSSAVGMASIEATESTLVRQKEPEKGMEREVMDFAMTDDLSSEPVPLSLDGIPVVGDYSMEENPDEDINLDPYSFLYNSMDEYETKVRDQYGVMSSDSSKGPEPISGISSISANSAEKAPSAPKAAKAPEAVPIAAPGSVPAKASAKDPAAAPSSAPATAPTAAPASVRAAAPYGAPAKDPAAAPYNAPASAPTAAPASVRAAAPYGAPAKDPVAAPYSAPAPAATKRCYACGHKMPVSDKFCPNCGRSTFGEPNPNRMPTPPPAPEKKKPTVLIIILIVVIIVMTALVLFFKKKADAAEISGDETTNIVPVSVELNDIDTSHYIPL